MIIGRGWRKLTFRSGFGRWPTIRGERPPEGVRFRCLEASFGSRCVQIRFWNWRRP